VVLDLMRVLLYVNGPTSVTLGYPPAMTCGVQEGEDSNKMNWGEFGCGKEIIMIKQ
jgi:hypothetical protein